MTRLLVDGVFFQLNSTGIARVWQMLLEILSTSEDLEIFFLDRGNAPEISGITYIPFKKYGQSSGTAEDSIAIQQVCDAYAIDAFTSSYYTTPLNTPMLMVVYDMIPELFAYDLRHRPWMEKQVTIAYAQRYLCISESTRRDLLSLYPEIPKTKAAVAHCGVDEAVFYQRSEAEVAAFRAGHGLGRPYFLFVGSRGERNNYKNSWLFFDALKTVEQGDFDVFCVGGEPSIEAEILTSLPPGIRCRQAFLTDDELALAYGGAVALVYPSLYEGFGMPVIEAMASGCPVITTSHGSLAEAAGDAAISLSGACPNEMKQALVDVRQAAVRDELRRKGFEQAAGFRWRIMAERFERELSALMEEVANGCYQSFFDEWPSIRTAQAQIEQDGP